MEYILLILFCLVCGACIANLFIQAEVEKRTVIYEKGDFLKIIKYRNGKKVSEKVFNGKWADLIYKFMGGNANENWTSKR